MALETVIFHFLKTGIFTTVQDFGRSGYQAFGVPIGGVLDKKSAVLANELVGNTWNNPIIEMTLIGAKILMEGSCQVAITGGNLSPMLNEKPFPMYQTVNISSGDIISFGKVLSGCRAYLAVGGEWQVQKWLGSCSASVQAAEQLTAQSIFRKHDRLVIKNPTFIPIKKHLNQKISLTFPALIRVVPAPEFSFFSREAIAYFFSQTYCVHHQSNRMGYRLLAERYRISSPEFSLISSGIVVGTVQIVPSGEPLVLLADAQTTGGYPRLVVVIEQDLWLFAQLKAGDTLRFQLIPFEDCLALSPIDK